MNTRKKTMSLVTGRIPRDGSLSFLLTSLLFFAGFFAAAFAVPFGEALFELFPLAEAKKLPPLSDEI